MGHHKEDSTYFTKPQGRKIKIICVYPYPSVVLKKIPGGVKTVGGFVFGSPSLQAPGSARVPGRRASLFLFLAQENDGFRLIELERGQRETRSGRRRRPGRSSPSTLNGSSPRCCASCRRVSRGTSL
jgi:hypothetical protein